MTTFARYQAGGSVSYGIVEGDAVKEISAAPYEDYKETGKTLKLSDVKLLAPVVPRKIVAIGLNYRSHLGGREGPKVPEPFFKVATSLAGPDDSIVIPRAALEEKVKMQPEAEMALVIGKTCKQATQANAKSFLLGVTCGNDVSARDWQANDLQWWRAKSSDTFSPIGPYIVSGLDPDKLQLKCRVNGKEVQNQNTSDLLHNVSRIIEFVSSAVTLEPGDVIMTGTPGSPGDIHPGDTVEVELEGVGVLKNPVRGEE
jgi:2-keto-4-pentenoate hydratase/2-oxohepta-3-ene-1,7-dioic acid hydratase in catechol pathway